MRMLNLPRYFGRVGHDLKYLRGSKGSITLFTSKVAIFSQWLLKNDTIKEYLSGHKQELES